MPAQQHRVSAVADLHALVKRALMGYREDILQAGVSFSVELGGARAQIDDVRAESALKEAVGGALEVSSPGDRLRLKVECEGDACSFVVTLSGGPDETPRFRREVRVPAARAPLRRAPVSMRLSTRRPRVVLLDENTGRLSVMAFALSKLGVEVIPAATVEAAVDLGRRESFDVLVARAGKDRLVEPLLRAHAPATIVMGGDRADSAKVSSLPADATPEAVSEAVLRLVAARGEEVR